MRFINNTSIYALSEAAQVAHQLIEDRDSKLHDSLVSKAFFYWSKNNDQKEWCHGQDASARLRNGPVNIKVFTYRPLNPFTRAIAMTDGGGSIHFNIYKLKSMSFVDDLVATICHEYGHLCGFGHGNNYKTNYKCEWSLPYYLSENASGWL
jgi:uncharacterized protein YjaZ